MSKPIAAVARIATTPEQAKIFAAMLQAEGIPAQVEGDSLADEVAVSRRLMNLGGTRVMVPVASLQRAKEILDTGGVDDDELAAQAEAATYAEVPPPTRPTAPARPTPWLLIGSIGLAALFLSLWLSEVNARTSMQNPLVRFERSPLGLRQIRDADGAVMAEYKSNKSDGYHDEVVQFAANGTRTESLDADRDGRYESHVERRGARTFGWLDTNGDGLFDVCTVTDAAGKKVQELRYVSGVGFSLQQF
ncbi:MAG: hypothetical protein ABIP94_02860 [Planctomycetota bacterium]